MKDDLGQIVIDRTIQRVKSLVEGGNSDTLALSLDLKDVRMLGEMQNAAVMATISARASVESVNFDRTVTLIAPVGSKFSVLDDGNSQWTTAMVGRKWAQAEKKNGANLDEEKRNETYLTSLTNKDAPDLEKLEIYSPWWSNLERSIKKARRDLKGLSVSLKKRPKNAKEDKTAKNLPREDLISRDISVILCKLESSLNSFWTSRSVRSGLVKALPLDDSNSLRCLELERQVTMASKVQTNGRVRLPHVSHKYRLCPFHTPESEKIGLQLFMAATAHRGEDGSGIKPAEKDDEQSLFSVAVGMVPYPHHSDGPRLMMGGKNLKQGEQSIEGGEPSLVPGYIEGARGKKLEALEGHLDEAGRFTPYLGSNALVAVMPWKGFTYEDGLVVSRSFTEKLKMDPNGKFDPKRQQTGKIYELKGEMLSQTGVKDFPELIERIERQVRGLAGEEKKTYTFDEPLPLPGVLTGERSHFYPWFMPGTLIGVSVKSARDRKRKDSLKSKVEIVYEFDIVRPLRIGDKITGRNGNKGVVTKIEEDDAMPKVVLKGPDCGERLETVDLIISPCSIVGRKNLGQILEMGHGLALKARDWGLIDDEVKSDDLYRGEEWRNTVLPILKKLGLKDEADKKSGFPVRYSEGDQKKEVRAFCGYQYISRLVHHVDKKLQARGTDGPSNGFIGQPTSGGAKAGQRLGEMENWAILSRGPLCSENGLDGHALDLLSSLRVSGEMQEDGQARTMDALEKLLWLAGVDGMARPEGSMPIKRVGSGQGTAPCLSSRIAHTLIANSDDEGYFDKKHQKREESSELGNVFNFPAPEEIDDLRKYPAVVTTIDQESSEVELKITEAIERCLENKVILDKVTQSWIDGAIKAMERALGLERGEESDHPILRAIRDMKIDTKSNDSEDQQESRSSSDSKGKMPCSPMALTLLTARSKDSWGIPFMLDVLLQQETLGQCYKALMEDVGKVPKDRKVANAVAYAVLTSLQKYHQILSNCVKGKRGILRGHVLGHRTNHSGRSVIVSRPELALDEVRLPVQLAVELLKDHDGLEILGLKGKLKDLRKKAHSGDAAKVKEVAKAINKALEEEGPLWCILIRQPSLHRHSVQAFKWTVWEEQAMAIPSMVTEGFNADFDGDTMAVYLPQDPWIRDLSGFTLKATPGRIGDGKLMIASGLDLALGWSALDRETKKEYLGYCYQREDVEEKSKGYATPLGDLVNAMVKNDPGWWTHLGQLQRDICAASTGCCSFPPDELDDLFVELKENRKEARSLEETEDYDPQKITQQELGELKEKYQNCEKTTEDVILAWLETHSNSHLSRMVRSKAKGSLSDLRQMCGFIGLQDIYSKTSEEITSSGEEDENKPILCKYLHESWIPGCFWTGLSDDELFVYSYASRDSMGDKKLATAQAGYLSRLLAEGLYDTLTESEDCGSGGRMEIYVQAVDEEKRRLSINYTFPEGHNLKPKGGYLWESPEIFPGDDVDSALESVLLGRWCHRIGQKADERIDLVDFDKLISADELDRLKDISKTINIGQGPVIIASCASPITCAQSERGVCSRCVGADIGRVSNRPVPVDMPVGLNAAMGIGERGTQLAMKRFHDVGSGVEGDPIKSLRQILVTGTRLASNLEGGQKEDGASPKKRRPRRALSERYRDLLDKVLTEPGSGDEERSHRFGELPQRLVLFELALRAPKGLSSWASDCEGRTLAAMAYERIDDILLKGGAEALSTLKSKVMFNKPWREEVCVCETEPGTKDRGKN